MRHAPPNARTLLRKALTRVIIVAPATEVLMKNPGFGPRHPPSPKSSVPDATSCNH